jgi:hypothetical protein
MQMKRISIRVALLWLGFLLAPAATTRADFMNGSFETGDLTGWSTPGSSGYVSVLTTYTSYGPEFTATDGEYYALLGAGLGTGVYTLLSQTFAASTGDVLSFDQFFQANDYLPFDDNAYGRLYDATSDTLVAELFYSDITEVGNYGYTPWTAVSYVFSGGGSYYLEFGVTNITDNGLSSVTAAGVVPEPSSLVLAGTGALAGLLGWRRRGARAGA